MNSNKTFTSIFIKYILIFIFLKKKVKKKKFTYLFILSVLI